MQFNRRVFPVIAAARACRVAAVATLLTCAAKADVVPVPLTPESFTHDVIVERSAPPPLIPVTTASMDAGTNNTGFSYYERGYSLDSPVSGLPHAGVRFTSELSMDHDFQLAPSYSSNNALLIDSTVPFGAFTLTVPAPFQRLSFLTAAGNGSGTISYTVHHQDGTDQTGLLPCPDWADTLFPAWTAYGRVEVRVFTFDSVNQNRPGIFCRDIELTNTASPVVKIDFGYRGGASHNAVFGVSGCSGPEVAFEPITVTGYNQDLIVETSATRRGILSGATTATMDNGGANWGWSWYERGYYMPAAGTGWPPAGTLLTSASAPDHTFLLPPSYASNNAVIVDESFGPAALTPQTPFMGSALSFLCASSRGPTTNQCMAYHADGTVETNRFAVPDWLGNEAPAFAAQGRVSTDTRMVDRVGTASPRVFAVDVPLANRLSAVTNIELAFSSGTPGSHTFVFAVSAVTTNSPPARPVLSLALLSGGALRLSTTVPGQLQSALALAGEATVWQNEGPIVSNLVVNPVGPIRMRFYRVAVQ